MQRIFIITNLFILGTVFASFISALAYRIYNQLPLAKLLSHPSYCEKCKHKLKWYELIPIYSWVVQKGRCRKCGSEISPWYLVGEITLAVNFVLFYIYNVSVIFYFVAATLFFLSIIDLLYMKIPKKVIHVLLFLGAFYFGFRFFIKFQIGSSSNIIWLDSRFIHFLPLVEAGILNILILLTNRIKKAFGFGDMLVIGYIAFFLDYSDFMESGSLIWIFALAGSFGVFCIIFYLIKGNQLKQIKKRRIPFIPLLYLGFVIFLVFQNFFLNFFFHLF